MRATLSLLAALLVLVAPTAAARACAAYSTDLSSSAAIISAGSVYPGQGPTNAFDDVSTGPYMSLDTSPSSFVGQDFGAAVREVRRVRLQGTASFRFNAKLQYSDDAVSWSDTSLAVSVPPGSVGVLTYDIPAYGAHRYWRFLDTGGSAYLQINEIELFACQLCGNGAVDAGEQCDGGACCNADCTLAGVGYSPDQTAVAAATAGGAVQPGYPAANAFDGSTSSIASLIVSSVTYVGQDFGFSGRNVRRLRVFRGSVGSYATAARLQYSDDGSSWFTTNVTSILVAVGDTSWHSFEVDDFGVHRYWRLDNIGSDYFQVGEVEMLEFGPTVCREASASCDAAERCSGTSAACPADGYAPAGTSCRAASGPCDVAELCDGSSISCPSDALASAGTSCRPAVVSCDAAELCDGTAALCPADVPPAQGVDLSAAATTIVGGSEQPGYPATGAFDNNTSSLTSVVSSPASYVGQDFGAPGHAIRRLRLYRGAIGSYPTSAALQYSDDGASWFATNVTSIQIAAGDSDWHPYEVDDFGTHRYWRLVDTGTQWFQIGEIEMYETTQCVAELHAASMILFAHDHLFEAQDFDNDQIGGLTAKVLKLTTDSIDWNRTTRERHWTSEPFDWYALWTGYRNDVEAIAANPANDVMVVRTVADIYAAKAQGKLGVIYGSEGANQLEGDIANVQILYDLGWRETQLWWSAGTPSDLKIGSSQLSSFGKQVVDEANRLGILIDVSHTSGALFDEVIARTAGPVIRSHDTPAAFGGESSDAMILQVTNSGGGHGVFALHFYEGYLGGGSATLDTMLDALEYVVNLAGIDHVALGADYFPENNIRWVLDDTTMLQEISARLIDRGYSYEDVQKILGLNLIRLYERAWNP